ncbi:MAG: hypothetical protein V2A58_09995 [Planctomycetota bacterium]
MAGMKGRVLFLSGLVVASFLTATMAAEQTNLLLNGSFEEGALEAPPPGWVEWKRNPSTFVTSADGREGGRCAKIVFQPGPECTFVLADQWIRMRPLKGERYRASCWVRAEASTPVLLFLYGGTHTSGESRGIALMARTNALADPEWKNLTAELDIPELATGVDPYLRFNLGFGGKAGTTVCVDDAMITKIRDAEAPTEPVVPAGTGLKTADAGPNLLANPSFEEGAADASPPGWVQWTRNPSEVLTAEGGRTGARSARVTLVKNEACNFVLLDQTVNLPLAEGERYGASCFVRAETPARVTLWTYGGTVTKGTSPGVSLVARADALVGPEWTPVSAELDIPELATGGDPYLRFAFARDVDGPPVYVDDAALVRLPSDRIASRPANFLTNPDFEAGDAGASPPGWVSWTRNPSTFATSEGGRSDGRCARIVLVPNDQCGFVLADQYLNVPLAKGERYRARCWVRSEKPTRVQVWLYGGTRKAGDNPGVELAAHTDATADSDWREVRTTLDIPEITGGKDPYLRFVLGLGGAAGAAVYIDDAEIVRLRRGENAALPSFSEVFEADQYEIGQNLPIEQYDRPIGASTTIPFKLPDGVEPRTAPAAFLWLSVDDFDAPEEVGIYVNGKGPARASGPLIGEGKDHTGYLAVNPSFLNPGTNALAFAFEDTVGGTTKGFGVIDARIILVRPGPASGLRDAGPVASVPMPGIGTLAVHQHLLPQIPMHRGSELGWKEHPIRKGDRHGGWTFVPGEHQLLVGKRDAGVMPFGLVQMDNGEVILAASHTDGDREVPVFAYSCDSGDTWSDWHTVPGTGGKPGSGRPMMLTYLGGGDLFFIVHGQRFFSKDYGRTWPERIGIPGPASWNEGNNLVDFDESGNVKAVAEVVCNLAQDDGSAWDATKPSNLFFRWSRDGARTWTSATRPEEWRWEETYKGKTYRRSASEGGLARAKNGWLVAAIRTDMPAWLAVGPNNDGVEGTGVSLSSDDGATWSPVTERILFEAGRHHANLVMLPNGDLVMTVIVRNDVRDGKLASYQRGCEAVLSRDNGATWEVAGRYVLDEYKYLSSERWFDGKCGHLSSTVLADGRVLSAYGNYLAKAAVLIRWKPGEE